MKISKGFALRNFISLEKENPRLFFRLIEEFSDMSSGGYGGPYRAGYTWTTVRKHYYIGWSDGDFQDVLNELENLKN